jgi:hypothetical protein
MPGYVQKALQRFNHEAPKRRQDSPHPWQKPQYGVKTQLTQPDTSAPLDATAKKLIQEIVGVFLYYGRAVDNTMLVALSAIATAQNSGTEKTMDAVVQLLNYAASHPNAVLRYVASDMYLHVHSDASYLSETKARSRYGGYFFLSDRPQDPSKAPGPNDPPPTHNGVLLAVTQVLREVVSAASEAECGGLFHNGKDAVPIRTTLEELGHEQGPTPIQTDNKTASDIANDDCKIKRSKAMDMRYFWVRDRVRQGQFLIYWSRGHGNKADYFTKHHPASHHRAVRHIYLHDPNNPSVVRGCVVPSVPPAPGIHDSKG